MTRKIPTMRDVLSRVNVPSYADDVRPAFLPTEQLKVHICSLCAAFGISPEFYDGDVFQAGSAPLTRRIRVPEIIGPVHYYVALHEIGHIVAEGAHRTDPEGIIDAEARAMQWACDTAIVARSKEVDEAIEMALASYTDNPSPPPDSPFWTIMSPRKLLSGLRRNDRYMREREQREGDEMMDLLGQLFDLPGEFRRWLHR